MSGWYYEGGRSPGFSGGPCQGCHSAHCAGHASAPFAPGHSASFAQNSNSSPNFGQGPSQPSSFGPGHSSNFGQASSPSFGQGHASGGASSFGQGPFVPATPQPRAFPGPAQGPYHSTPAFHRPPPHTPAQASFPPPQPPRFPPPSSFASRSQGHFRGQPEAGHFPGRPDVDFRGQPSGPSLGCHGQGCGQGCGPHLEQLFATPAKPFHNYHQPPPPPPSTRPQRHFKLEMETPGKRSFRAPQPASQPVGGPGQRRWAMGSAASSTAATAERLTKDERRHGVIEEVDLEAEEEPEQRPPAAKRHRGAQPSPKAKTARTKVARTKTPEAPSSSSAQPSASPRRGSARRPPSSSPPPAPKSTKSPAKPSPKAAKAPTAKSPSPSEVQASEDELTILTGSKDAASLAGSQSAEEKQRRSSCSGSKAEEPKANPEPCRLCAELNGTAGKALVEAEMDAHAAIHARQQRCSLAEARLLCFPRSQAAEPEEGIQTGSLKSQTSEPAQKLQTHFPRSEEESGEGLAAQRLTIGFESSQGKKGGSTEAQEPQPDSEDEVIELDEEPEPPAKVSKPPAPLSPPSEPSELPLPEPVSPLSLCPASPPASPAKSPSAKRRARSKASESFGHDETKSTGVTGLTDGGTLAAELESRQILHRVSSKTPSKSADSEAQKRASEAEHATKSRSETPLPIPSELEEEESEPTEQAAIPTLAPISHIPPPSEVKRVPRKPKLLGPKSSKLRVPVFSKSPTPEEERDGELAKQLVLLTKPQVRLSPVRVSPSRKRSAWQVLTGTRTVVGGQSGRLTLPKADEVSATPRLPLRFYAGLSLRQGSAEGGCLVCSQCHDRVPPQALEDHVYSHRKGPKALFRCLLCHTRAPKATVSPATHWAKKHSRGPQRMTKEEAFFEDFRPAQDAELSELLGSLFPLPPLSAPEGLRRSLRELCERRGKLACAFPGCGAGGGCPTEGGLFEHLLDHAGDLRPPFHCRLCPFAGLRIVDHAVQRHFSPQGADAARGKLPKLSSWLSFTHLTHESELSDLLERCFPSGRKPVASLPPFQPEAQKTSLQAPPSPPPAPPRPVRFLGLLAILSSRASQGRFSRRQCGWRAGPSGEPCGARVGPSFDFASHVYGHCRLSLFRCRACGRTLTGGAGRHVEKRHKGEAPPDFEDLRPAVERDLVKALEHCFPDLLASKFLFPSRSSTSLHAAYQAVAKEAAKVAPSDALPCRIQGCGASVAKPHSSLAIEAHILSHLSGETLKGRRVFECSNCAYKGVEILEHCLQAHFQPPSPLEPSQSADLGDWLRFSDHRKELFAPRIAALLKEAFPKASKTPSPPPPPKAAAPSPTEAPAKPRTSPVNESQALGEESQLAEGPERADSEKDSSSEPLGPVRFLSLLGALGEGARRSGAFPPCALCAWRPGAVGEEALAEVEAHAMAHDPTQRFAANFQCRGECGVQFPDRASASAHGVAEHEDGAFYTDRRAQRQDGLCRQLAKAYPALRTPEFWLQSRRRHGRLLEVEVEASRAAAGLVGRSSAECGFPSCGRRLNALDALGLHGHALGHFRARKGLSPVACAKCMYDGLRFVEHGWEEHCGRELEELFVDQRPRHDRDLARLLRACFPPTGQE